MNRRHISPWLELEASGLTRHVKSKHKVANCHFGDSAWFFCITSSKNGAKEREERGKSCSLGPSIKLSARTLTVCHPEVPTSPDRYDGGYLGLLWIREQARQPQLTEEQTRVARVVTALPRPTLPEVVAMRRLMYEMYLWGTFCDNSPPPPYLASSWHSRSRPESSVCLILSWTDVVPLLRWLRGRVPPRRQWGHPRVFRSTLRLTAPPTSGTASHSGKTTRQLHFAGFLIGLGDNFLPALCWIGIVLRSIPTVLSFWSRWRGSCWNLKCLHIKSSHSDVSLSLTAFHVHIIN